MDCPGQVRPFKLRGELTPTPSGRLNALIESFIVRLFALERLGRLYRVLDTGLPLPTFLERVLDALRVRYEVRARALGRVPAAGAGHRGGKGPLR